MNTAVDCMLVVPRFSPTFLFFSIASELQEARSAHSIFQINFPADSQGYSTIRDPGRKQQGSKNGGDVLCSALPSPGSGSNSVEECGLIWAKMGPSATVGECWLWN